MLSQSSKENPINLSGQIYTIVQNTIEEISLLADQSNQNIEESTHVIRKRLKFLRAVVKLTMYCLDSEIYKDLNIMLRDCGREISDCRDQHVKVFLLQEIRENCLLEPVRSLVEELILINRAETKKEEQELLSGKNTFNGISLRLSSHTDFINYFYTLRANFETLLKGFAVAYSKSYNAFQAGLTSQNVDSWHEWRKRTKDLQYQYEVLMQSIPERLPSEYADLVELCEILGRINDFYMLSAWISEKYNLTDHHEQNSILVEVIQQEINILHKEAVTHGNSLYRYAPNEYEEKLEEIVE